MHWNFRRLDLFLSCIGSQFQRCANYKFALDDRIFFCLAHTKISLCLHPHSKCADRHRVVRRENRVCATQLWIEFLEWQTINWNEAKKIKMKRSKNHKIRPKSSFCYPVAFVSVFCEVQQLLPFYSFRWNCTFAQMVACQKVSLTENFNVI